MARQDPRTADSSSALRHAFEAAAAAAAAIAQLEPQPPTAVQQVVAGDLAGGTVLIDRYGLTAGCHAGIVAPLRQQMQRWVALRAVFLAALEPRRADMDAVEALPQVTETLRQAGAAEILKLRQDWADRPRNALVERQWQIAEVVYQRESQRHGQRLAVMHATSPWYWGAMLLIGVAEWLINYDVFLSFTGVVAIAAGATIILGVLLAFAAHGHGEVLKQWSYRFGRFQTREARVGAGRMLALSTFAVFVVLGAAGGSRYAAVLRTLSRAHPPDMIGGGYQLEANPMRDVLLSLLANIAAWIVGVFISYFSHDVDPEFMAATHQHRRSSRAFFRARRRLEEDVQVVEERTSRAVAAAETTAAARRASTQAERGMLAQMTQHDAAVRDALMARLKHDLARYRAELVRAVQAGPPGLRLLAEHEQGAPFAISADALPQVPLIADTGLLEQAA